MDQLLERFKKLDTTCVSDAMDKIGIECAVSGVKPIQRASGSVVGPLPSTICPAAP